MSQTMDEAASRDAAVKAAMSLLVPKEEAAPEEAAPAQAAPQPDLSRMPGVPPLLETPPEPVAEPEAVEPPADPFAVEIPPELAALLAEPEIDELEDDPPAYEPPVSAAPDDGEYVDPEVAELRKRAEAAEKKAAHYEKLRLDASKKTWAAEAKEFFPLSNPDDISATSRRDFLRQAKSRHDSLKPTVEAFLAAEREKLQAQAAAMWGRPTVAGPQVPGQATEEVEAERRAQEAGGFDGLLKHWVKSGKLQI